MDAKNLIPFRAGTRQSLREFGRADVAVGTAVSTELPRVGMLSGILLNFRGTATFTGAGTLKSDAPWNVLKNIQVNVNNGTTIYKTSGFGALIVNQRFLARGYDPFNSGIYQNSVNNGANQWEFSLYIPIGLNRGLQFDIGLLNLQAQEIRVTCDLTFASTLAEIATNLTGLTGSVDMHYEYFELPDQSRVAMPLPFIHRILEETQPITTVGDNTYLVPREGSLLQLAHVVTLNGLNAINARGNFPGQVDQVDSMRLVLNKTQTVYSASARAMALKQLMDNHVYPGVYEWNFMDAGVTGTGEGDTRDTFDSRAISTLESILTINSGATLGTVASLRSIRRIVQGLVK